MLISDSIEEYHFTSSTPFGEHTLRFIRVADNNVLLILDGKIVSLFSVDEQVRMVKWFSRRVQEAL